MASIDNVRVRKIRVPTDTPESDGTLEWDATVVVLCEIEAEGSIGIGYTYASSAAAVVIEETLRDCLVGADPLLIGARWLDMRRAVRNLGQRGVASMAISAVDIALWEWYARVLGEPLHRVLGTFKDSVPGYGSGGFTSYSSEQMASQLETWLGQGFRAVKIKVGREPSRDVSRVREARELIGDTDLYVDANGAYGRRQALELGESFADLGVTWYEEPVSSDDVLGLAWLRARCPSTLRIAAGEYGYGLDDFKRLLDAGAIDVLMADATRCGGVTGFLQVAALARAYHVPISSHCAPSVHLQLGCAAPGFETAEYFHDHARIEHMLFDGAATVRAGHLAAEERAGLGIDVGSLQRSGCGVRDAR